MKTKDKDEKDKEENERDFLFVCTARRASNYINLLRCFIKLNLS